MRDADKTKEDLIGELAGMRQRIAQSEEAPAKLRRQQGATRVPGVITDKTSQKKAAEEPVTANEGPARILSANPAAIYSTKPDGDYGTSSITDNITTHLAQERKAEEEGINGELPGEIAERERLEEALRESEAKYRHLAEHASDILWTVDLEMRTTYVSASIERVLGYTPEERMQQNVRDQLTPESFALAQSRLLEELRRDGEQEIRPDESVVLELDYRHKNGSIVCLESVMKFLRDEAGTPIGIHGLSRDITERKKAEKALRESEERYRRLFSVSPDGIMVNSDGKCVLANRAAARMLGASNPDDLVGMPIKRFVHPDYHQIADDRIERLVDGQEIAPIMEEKFIRLDGRVIDVEVTASPFPLAVGSAFQVVFRDITDLKRTQRLQIESEKKYHDLFEQSTDGIGIVRFDGTFVDVNGTFSELLGYSREEVLAMNAKQVWVDPADRARWQEEMGQKGSVVGYEWRARKKDGTIIDCILNSVMHRGEDGSITYHSICRDISAQKKAQEELKKSRERYRALVGAIPDPVVAYDREGKATYINEAFTETYGWNREEILGQVIDFVPPEETQKTRESWERVFRGERDLLETKRLTKEGDLLDIQLRVASLLDEDGNFSENIVIHRDITQRKKAEEALVRSRAELEYAYRRLVEAHEDAEEMAVRAAQASSAKSEFLARMSHEIRTPINGILGMIQLALSTELTHEQREYLDLATTSADILIRLIEDILDFSRIEAGKLEIVPAKFSLRDCVFDAVAQFSVQADAKGLELVCHVAEDIPDVVVGDAVRLSQVLANLVANSIKFTSQGEVVVEVRADTIGPDYVLLQFDVRDTGIGISAENQERIFRAFEQAEGSSTRRHGGVGLGLAICKQLVRMMGGRICLESEAGVGSRFYFVVRLEVIEHVTTPSRASAMSEVRGLKVLLVDDNATARKLLGDLLATWGMKPISVSNGPAALDTLKSSVREREPFDIVLLGAPMSGADNFEVAEFMRQEADLLETPIIMMGSVRRRSDVRRCESLRIRSRLSKPVRPSDLLSAISQGFKRIPQEQALASPRTSDAFPMSARPLKILLVEDTDINRKVAVNMLEKMGHTVTIAADGKEAVSLHRHGDFDLIFMDVEMPEMDGMEATGVIREREAGTGRRIPIIATTAHAMAGDEERFLAGGMDGYIAKPIKSKILYETIERFGRQDMQDRSERSAVRCPAPQVRSLRLLPEDLPGIDPASALARLGGDEQLLISLVLQFARNYRHAADEIMVLWERSNPDAARQLAHSVKGVSGNLSATDLHAAATDLEEALRKRDREGFLPLFHHFAKMLDVVLRSADGLEAILGTKTGGSDTPTDEPAHPGRADIPSVLMELSGLLRDHDAESLELVKVLNSVVHADDAERPLVLLNSCMERFDFEGALQALIALGRVLDIALPRGNS